MQLRCPVPAFVRKHENLSDMEFEYVVSLYPDAVRIRLKTGGIMEERAYETSD